MDAETTSLISLHVTLCKAGPTQHNIACITALYKIKLDMWLKRHKGTELIIQEVMHSKKSAVVQNNNVILY